jgi:hypothetical protein
MRALVIGGAGFIEKRLINPVHGEIRVLSHTRQSNYETIICDLQSGVIPDNAFNGLDTVFI